MCGLEPIVWVWACQGRSQSRRTNPILPEWQSVGPGSRPKSARTTQGPGPAGETRANEPSDGGSGLEMRRTDPTRPSGGLFNPDDRTNRQDPSNRYGRRASDHPEQNAERIRCTARIDCAIACNRPEHADAVGTDAAVGIACQRMTPTDPGDETLSWGGRTAESGPRTCGGLFFVR